MQSLSVSEFQHLSQNSSILTQKYQPHRMEQTCETVVVGSPEQTTLEQRLKETMDSLSTQIQLLTQVVTALTEAIKENTEAMGGEEEEVVQTGGFLGDTAEDDAPAPHL